MDPILEAIEKGREAKGLSAAAASRLAVGHPSLIKNFRMQREGEKRYNVAALQKLANVLDLEFYFGPPRTDTSDTVLNVADDDFAAIPVRDVEASAGPGAVNYTDLPDDDAPMAFRRDWLSRLGINPARAVILRVRGDSMEPTIRAGSIALIDQQRTDPAKNRIYAFVDDGELRMKRLQMMPHKAIGMFSDNPAYLPEIKKHSDLHGFKILGEVVWTAYNWHDDPRAQNL